MGLKTQVDGLFDFDSNGQINEVSIRLSPMAHILLSFMDSSDIASDEIQL